MSLRTENRYLVGIDEDMVDESMFDPEADLLGPLSIGMDAAAQRRLRVKRMHDIKGNRKPRKPQSTSMPYSLRKELPGVDRYKR